MLAVCHGIIALSRNVITPITVELAIHTHHNFRSKHIFEVFHFFGYSFSYDEVKKFETSAALH